MLGIKKNSVWAKFYATYKENIINLRAVRLLNFDLELKHSFFLPKMFSPLVDDNTFWTSVIVIFVPFNATVRETCKYFVCVWKVVHDDNNKEIIHLIK